MTKAQAKRPVAAPAATPETPVRASGKSAAKAAALLEDGGVAVAEAPSRPAKVDKPAAKAKPAAKVAPKAQEPVPAKPVKAAKPAASAKAEPAPTVPAATKTAKSIPSKKAVPATAEAPAPSKLAAKPAVKKTAPAAQPPAVPTESLAPVARPAQPASWSATRAAPAARAPSPQMIETFMDQASVLKVNPKLANAWKTKAGHELTDEEVMAMPEDEYMNDKQLAFFKHKLEQLKEGLLSAAGETTEHLREDTSVVPDPADRATIEEEHALELRTRDRERKLLKKINQSISRIDSGEYGYCDETGEPIGLGRLIARPTANLSLEAQQRRELKQKLFGD